jgi:hypothetical protein
VVRRRCRGTAARRRARQVHPTHGGLNDGRSACSTSGDSGGSGSSWRTRSRTAPIAPSSRASADCAFVVRHHAPRRDSRGPALDGQAVEPSLPQPTRPRVSGVRGVRHHHDSQPGVARCASPLVVNIRWTPAMRTAAPARHLTEDPSFPNRHTRRRATLPPMLPSADDHHGRPRESASMKIEVPTVAPAGASRRGATPWFSMRSAVTAYSPALGDVHGRSRSSGTPSEWQVPEPAFSTPALVDMDPLLDVGARSPRSRPVHVRDDH